MTDGPETGGSTSDSGEPAPKPSGAPARWWGRRRRTGSDTTGSHRAGSRRRRIIIRSGLSVVLLTVIVVGTAVGYAVYRLNQIHRITSANVVKATGATENILLIGSTDRCSATQIREFKLQCQAGVNGVNSDVVLIAHLDPATGQASLLSIPRDTFLPGARAGGVYNRIDAALADGPDQLVSAIEQDFGIPINHFVELNFATFENVVNALGGLRLDFPYRLVDASSGLFVYHTGCISLNGSEALALVRSRHLYWFKRGQHPNLQAIQAATDNGTYFAPSSGGQYDGSGDLGRITRVHLFLDALGRQVKQRGLGNPLTDNALIGAIAPNLTVDSTFGDSELAHLALEFRHVSLSSMPQLTLPIVINNANYLYGGYSYGDVVFPTEPQDQRAIDRFLGQTTPGLHLRPSSISVSVVDGTNSPGATATTASELGALGFRIVTTGQTDYVGPVSETTVRYAKGHLAQAERVLHELRGTVVLGEGTPAGGATVSVVTGSDLRVDHPPARRGATASRIQTVPAPSSPATAPTAPPVGVNPNLGEPTSSTSSIPAYDPRACPVGASGH